MYGADYAEDPVKIGQILIEIGKFMYFGNQNDPILHKKRSRMTQKRYGGPVSWHIRLANWMRIRLVALILASLHLVPKLWRFKV